MICFRAPTAFDDEVTRYCKKYGISKADFFRLAGYDLIKGPPLSEKDQEMLEKLYSGMEKILERLDVFEKSLSVRVPDPAVDSPDIDHYKQALLDHRPASMNDALVLLLDLYPLERDTIVGDRMHARAIASLGLDVVRITSPIQGTLEWIS